MKISYKYLILIFLLFKLLIWGVMLGLYHKTTANQALLNNMVRAIGETDGSSAAVGVALGRAFTHSGMYMDQIKNDWAFWLVCGFVVDAVFCVLYWRLRGRGTSK
jgi:hypothetical protein